MSYVIDKNKVDYIIEEYLWDEGWYTKANMLQAYVDDEENRVKVAVAAERDRIYKELNLSDKEKVSNIIEDCAIHENTFTAERLLTHIAGEIYIAKKEEREKICKYLQDINTNNVGMLWPATSEALKKIRENKI